MDNRFSNFTQRELEILHDCLRNVEAEKVFLPQHKDRMEKTCYSLIDEMQPNLRATNNSPDGSHFGEIYCDEVRA